MLVFLESNLTGFQMDWTLLSFLNKVFVLAIMSYFVNAVCMCVAQKMQCNTKTCGSKCNAKNDVPVTFEMAWHAIFKNRANQHVLFI